MSRQDIRSFFTVLSKKSNESKGQPPAKKKPKRLIDSDEDDDIVEPTPESKQKGNKRCKPIVVSSDSEDLSPKKKSAKHSNKDTKKVSTSPKKQQKVVELISSSDSEAEEAKKKISKPLEKKKEPDLKPVNIGDIFKKTPVKQSKVEPPKVITPKPEEKEKDKRKTKKKKKGFKEDEKSVHADKKFEDTLDDLDDSIFEGDDLEKTINEALQTEPSEINGRKRSREESVEKTPKKKKIEHVDSGIDPGQEAHERKRYSAALYQKYLNRSGPKHHGAKELPKGKPDCLKNLCFLRTGVLDSLESEEFEKLVTDHGGRVVHGVSKKVNYVVVGDEPGPSKLAKAESYNIPTISEDELLDMILVKSEMSPKYCKKDSSSEDQGIEIDSEPVKDVKKEKKEATKEKVSPKKETQNSNKETPKKKQELQAKTTEKKNTSPKKTNSKEDTNKLVKPEVASLEIKTEPLLPKLKPAPTQALQQPSNLENIPLNEKYRPQSLKSIIGQQGESSSLNKLKNWLGNWHQNREKSKNKALIKPSPWAKNDDGSYFKCALLSGPPGVGKTTSATVVAKELGFDIVEFNASDTRSKKLLHQEVAQILQTKTLAGFAAGNENVARKRVLLMDEVDGMSGNEDRGGMQELIQLIKTTSIPIICMCNDRNHQKMRSLLIYVYDLRFNKPRLEQIKGAMMSVCFKEKIEISPQALSDIIAGTGCDIRQTLNHLSMLASTKEKITSEVAEKEAKSAKKDTVMGPWEVCRAVFTKSEHKNMSVADKARLFFYDYSIGPLFIQENYLRVQPDGVNKKRALLNVALAASSISMGDIIDSKIRKSNNWSLLESQAFFSSVIPGHHMSGTFDSQINFPSWLGKNSKKNKFSRLQSEIQCHTKISASASKLAIKLDYILPLRNAIVFPLKQRGLQGVDEAVSVMKDYSLLREDVDSLMELGGLGSKDNPMTGVDSKVKTAFTKAYNKQVLLPFAPSSAVSKKKTVQPESDIYGEEEEEVSDNEKDEDLSKNAMIKVKNKTSAKGKKAADEPGTSKKNETKKGKGKKK